MAFEPNFVAASICMLSSKSGERALSSTASIQGVRRMDIAGEGDAAQRYDLLAPPGTLRFQEGEPSVAPPLAGRPPRSLIVAFMAIATF